MKPELTAISRTSLPVPAKKALAAGFITGKILDYGSGRGIIKQILPNVTNYDPYFSPKRPTGEFDTVLCLYVLNVLLPPARITVMQGIGHYLKKGGTAIIAVRTPQDIKSALSASWKKVEDGYITPKDTFQHGINYAEMTELAKKGHLRIYYKLDSNTYVLKRA